MVRAERSTSFSTVPGLISQPAPEHLCLVSSLTTPTSYSPSAVESPPDMGPPVHAHAPAPEGGTVARRRQLSGFSVLRCVTGEDKVACFGRLVAGKAGLVQRLVARLSVLKVSESPAAVAAYFFESLTMN